MPSDHQSHQPNTLNGELDDLDSDLDLEIDELGPSRDSRLDRNAKGARIHETGQSDHTGIPLKSLRNGSTRLSGRRAKRFESNSLEDAPGDGTHTREGSLSQNIGDATPLLAEDNTKQKEEKASNGSILAWIGIRSRRAEYQNITDAGEEDNDTTAPRTIDLGQWPPPKFPANAISNAKYTPWSFLPRTLYNEFSFFINLYFLTVALSQLIPPLRIGVLWTYMAPLAFVLTITLGKEAYDDVIRRKRDGEANRELYTKLRLRGPMIIDRNKASRRKNLDSTRRRRTSPSRLDAISEEEEETGTDLIQMDEVLVKSKDIKVGDVLKLSKNDRVPADVVLLKSFAADTSFIPVSSKSAEQDELLLEETVPMKDLSTKAPVADPEPIGPDGSGSGETFIRTDQLDGETDWKLRVASQLTQSLHPSQYSRLSITAGKPSKKVNEFLGKIELSAVPSGDVKIRATSEKLSAPLSLENTAWANTVLSSNVTVLAAVVYTGSQTRQALSTAPSRSKVGLLELEINNLTKILCLLTLTLSAVLVILQVHFKKLQMPWYVSLCRFLILFSSIIPISLRVNLDIGKTVYAYNIHHDKDMPGAVVRTSTIPEDLGRIEYLLSDKTGTLTQNGMRFIHCDRMY